MTIEDKAVLARAAQIMAEEEARREAARRAAIKPEFSLIHEEEGYRILRRNISIPQWWLYYGEELITTSQYRKGAFGALNHILAVKHICLGL